MNTFHLLLDCVLENHQQHNRGEDCLLKAASRALEGREKPPGRGWGSDYPLLLGRNSKNTQYKQTWSCRGEGGLFAAHLKPKGPQVPQVYTIYKSESRKRFVGAAKNLSTSTGSSGSTTPGATARGGEGGLCIVCVFNRLKNGISGSSRGLGCREGETEDYSLRACGVFGGRTNAEEIE